MKPAPLILGIVLAAASFGYARYQYVQSNTATTTIAGKTFTAKNPFTDKNLFGDWVKDAWPLAIAIPAACLAGGLVLSFKK